MSGRIFRPFTIGPFRIIPEGEPSGAEPGIPLILGRKGAFGSGEHETTMACLEELARLPDLAGARVLDLGSGTGILAIAAARLGATSVVALDIDPAAALSCDDNARLNGLQDVITSICGELSTLPDDCFDILLANIYADIHLLLGATMVDLTRPGGCLILSGIPLQDKFDVQQKFLRAGCVLVDSRIGEEYATYVMGKPDVCG